MSEMMPLQVVMSTELKALTRRRQRHGLHAEGVPAGDQETGASPTDVREVRDTLGVCISAGGLRSAAFSLGVLHEFAAADLLKRVDYLSTVSGGSCAGASLFSHANSVGVSQEGSGGSSPTQNQIQPDSFFRSRGTVERALQRLMRQSAPGAPGLALLTLQLSIMVAMLVVVVPMMAAAASSLAAASVTDAIGDTLHALLADNFRPLQLAVVAVFFGPIWAGLCCFMSALATDENDILLHKPSSHSKTSVPGQVAAMGRSLMASISCVIVLMVLEQRLLEHTIMDEVLLLAVWLAWAAASVHTLLCADRRAQVRYSHCGLGARALPSLQMAVCVCGLWLTSRACVSHVMHREGNLAYSTVCLWLVMMVVVQDVLMAGVNSLFRFRLRVSFLDNAASRACGDTHQKRNFLSAEDERDGSQVVGDSVAFPLHGDAISAQGHALNVGEQGGGASAHQSIFSLTSRSAFASSRTLQGQHHQRFAQRRRLGDVYYGPDNDGSKLPRLLDLSSCSACFLRSVARSVAMVEAAAAAVFGWRSHGVGLQVDPSLRDAEGEDLPYLLMTVAASGYVRTSGSLHAGTHGARVGQELSWPFLLSPGWCGSERTGFFPTPNNLQLSDAMALSAGDDFFASALGDCALIRPLAWLGMSGADWMRLPQTSPSSAHFSPPPSPSLSPTWIVKTSENPKPNFFLDSTGSRPIRAAELRDRDRTPRAMPAVPQPLVSSARNALCGDVEGWGRAHGSVGCDLRESLETCSWAAYRARFSSTAHRLVFPRVARFGVPVLVIVVVVSVVHPAVLLVAAALGGMLVAMSLLPEGHPLLGFGYIREAHRLLGCVVASRKPPPYLFLSDVSSDIDPLGLLELLRRRCSRIIVCDATCPNQPCSASDEGEAATEGDVGQDSCRALLRVLERARSEGLCAFLPGRGERGDVETAVRQFQRDTDRRVLQLHVEYLHASEHAAVIKSGSIVLLKCRETREDADIAPHYAGGGAGGNGYASADTPDDGAADIAGHYADIPPRYPSAECGSSPMIHPRRPGSGMGLWLRPGSKIGFAGSRGFLRGWQGGASGRGEGRHLLGVIDEDRFRRWGERGRGPFSVLSDYVQRLAPCPDFVSRHLAPHPKMSSAQMKCYVAFGERAGRVALEIISQDSARSGLAEKDFIFPSPPSSPTAGLEMAHGEAPLQLATAPLVAASAQSPMGSSSAAFASTFPGQASCDRSPCDKSSDRREIPDLAGSEDDANAEMPHGSVMPSDPSDGSDNRALPTHPRDDSVVVAYGALSCSQGSDVQLSMDGSFNMASMSSGSCSSYAAFGGPSDVSEDETWRHIMPLPSPSPSCRASSAQTQTLAHLNAGSAQTLPRTQVQSVIAQSWPASYSTSCLSDTSLAEVQSSGEAASLESSRFSEPT